MMLKLMTMIGLFLLIFNPLKEGYTQQKNAELGIGWDYFTKGQYQQAFAPLKKKAEQGHSEAQYAIGWMYQLGKGTVSDQKIALEWYQKAAQQGHLSAQNNLCTVYLGLRNFNDALTWCEKAANQGHQKAQFLLGMMYYNGQGVTKNMPQSIHWLTKSAEQKYAAAEYKLGFFYKNGVGVTLDMIQAQKYFERAASQNYKNAIDHLKCLTDKNSQVKSGLASYCDSLVIY